ncbi:aspartate beta-hydroxylase domain-containing protein 2 isoform X2 [Lates japonicus]|uniref:Aspartate beta-hydroxylase domain-containing protein 2 isoform X2 n=1 Tax=Lates japonicus TaxID=270547 RepID=A0AAD3R241_LATJO|nr:aspartate beta-hydroxylase domain-containing protein 2 isoform X2 [Lates japonicus]
MVWSLENVREMVAGGMQSIRECEICAFAIAMCVLLLFMWYCYRVGREHGSSPLRGRYLAGPGRIGGVVGGFMSSDCRGRGKGKHGSMLEEQNGFAFCQSSECFRCTSAGESLNQRLYHSLQDYAKRYTWSGRCRDLTWSFWAELPPSYRWFGNIYHQPPASQLLPPTRGDAQRAWRVLGQLRTFIANNVFGDACFSVLTPGALITEHDGPTNVRLRCHLGLKFPLYELVVGQESHSAGLRSCLLSAIASSTGPFTRMANWSSWWISGTPCPLLRTYGLHFTPGRLEMRKGNRSKAGEVSITISIPAPASPPSATLQSSSSKGRVLLVGRVRHQRPGPVPSPSSAARTVVIMQPLGTSASHAPHSQVPDFRRAERRGGRPSVEGAESSNPPTPTTAGSTAGGPCPAAGTPEQRASPSLSHSQPPGPRVPSLSDSNDDRAPLCEPRRTIKGASLANSGSQVSSPSRPHIPGPAVQQVIPPLGSSAASSPSDINFAPSSIPLWAGNLETQGFIMYLSAA